MKIKLGDKAKDDISGFEGIVTAKAEYLNGCTRYELSPNKLEKDGGLIESEFFDEQQVSKISPPKSKVKKNKIGGSRPNPKYLKNF